MMMGDGFGWMWLFGLLVLVGIVLLIVAAVRAVGGGINRNAPPAAGHRTAREVLDERYTHGELTSDEYRERLRTLDEGR